MVWGCFSGFGSGSLFPVKCIATATAYKDICGNGLEETLSCSIMTLPQKDMG